MTVETVRTYPVHHDIGGQRVTLRPMEPGDREAVLAFARKLPEHDLLFLRRDITQPEAVDDWIAEIARGEILTILAEADGEVAGYATIHRNSLRWTAHVAELRVTVAEAWRGKGLGRLLTQEAFANALGLGIEKMIAQMTLDQKGAIATFEGLGFRPEALLRDQVKDRDGNKHDLLVLSHDVARFEAVRSAYGVAEALGGR
ncbi:GNAT family N-acetyltransferase [Tepidiforma sp.]|uniref:GNAT family N-acetyltransferase n=1 Tax=Tepidiforma sp. TaxID=2682230 RepID=UPI0021DE0FE7|nr:GNAT family N-acetyltransferase [Tepidiforma sp.]MCX7616379.1 GNAT family N-acetyltransferase [Tepidiforma sp.]GIW19093.1 MAG: N-acetyltransferase [Tepidiforma sp.]